MPIPNILKSKRLSKGLSAVLPWTAIGDISEGCAVRSCLTARVGRDSCWEAKAT